MGQAVLHMGCLQGLQLESLTGVFPSHVHCSLGSPQWQWGMGHLTLFPTLMELGGRVERGTGTPSPRALF